MTRWKRERLKTLRMDHVQYDEYCKMLREEYAAIAFSTSRLLSRLVMAGGWPW